MVQYHLSETTMIPRDVCDECCNVCFKALKDVENVIDYDRLLHEWNKKKRILIIW